MNEEEFIENLNTREKEDIYDLGFKRGIEKGKLEQKKEELLFWDILKKCEVSNKILVERLGERLNRLYHEFEDIQKEIGGMK